MEEPAAPDRKNADWVLCMQHSVGLSPELKSQQRGLIHLQMQRHSPDWADGHLLHRVVEKAASHLKTDHAEGADVYADAGVVEAMCVDNHRRGL